MNIKRYETPYLKVIRFDIKKDVMEMVTENFYGDETQVYESNPDISSGDLDFDLKSAM